MVAIAHHKQTPSLRTSGTSLDLPSFFLPTKVLCKYDNPINWAIIILQQGIPPLGFQWIQESYGEKTYPRNHTLIRDSSLFFVYSHFGKVSFLNQFRRTKKETCRGASEKRPSKNEKETLPKNVLHIKLRITSAASDQDTPSTLIQWRWDDCNMPSKKGERNATKRAAKKKTSSSKRIARILNAHLLHPFR
eukprot:scaffold258190_cov69-Attheya_sp.AAC.1